MPVLRRLTSLIDRLNTRIGDVTRWLALLMVLVGAYTAIARYLTRFAGVPLSSNALNELQWYLFSVIFLLGAAYGLERNAHVRVDVLYGRLSAKGRAWIDLLGTLVFLVPFSVLMLWASWPGVRTSWRIREVSPDPGGLPRYPIKALVLVSFALLILQGLSYALKQVDILRAADAEPEPGGDSEKGGGGSSGRESGGPADEHGGAG